jgi:hypothetical protein
MEYNMERDPADIIDRAVIAKLKSERICLDESKKEWSAFEKELDILKNKYTTIPIDMFFDLLLKINSMIWSLESDVRQGKLDGALSEVGRRAIEIREHNNLRVQTKNILNKLCNAGFMDIKKEHISSNE